MPLRFRTRDLPLVPKTPGAARSLGEESISENPLRIALVNNMPDSALEDTEAQFIELLKAAALDFDVALTPFSIPTVPRGEKAQKRISDVYFKLADLLGSRFDGVIVTGTEPRQPDLRLEPYWNELAGVMDWAEECSHSAILSCLSAHAGVLHSDGISRLRLDDKRFGVFPESKVARHPLTESLSSPVYFPHSRWNDLSNGELVAAGYTVLTCADHVGVGLFAKEKKSSLFVYFQGHPEYAERTLLKEYRRDVRRFLLGERETYPSLPRGYFDVHAEELFNSFKAEALQNRSEKMMSLFPGDGSAITPKKTWHHSSVTIYKNWLHYLANKRSQSQGKCASMQAAGG
jgi:homoserine O-succinyltransferase/O-acetyltransferase